MKRNKISEKTEHKCYELLYFKVNTVTNQKTEDWKEVKVRIYTNFLIFL